MADVSVPRSVLVALGAVVVGLLVAVAFLVGRESGRQSGPQPVHAVIRPPARPSTLPPDPPPDETRPTAAVPKAPVNPLTVVEVPQPATQMRAPPPSGWTNLSEVAAYLRAIDAIQIGSGGGGAEGFAQGLMAAAGEGDLGPLRDVVNDARDAERKAQSISPPAACRAYHAKLVGMLGESRRMMEELERAMANSDGEALAGIASRATAMQGRVDALKAEGDAIKKRHGIAP